MQLSLKTFFHAAHFYEVKSKSAEENKTLFGASFSPYGHGHNYELQIDLEIPPQLLPITSKHCAIWQAQLDQLIGSKFHQKHLNRETSEFTKINPTTENLAVVAFDLLQASRIFSDKVVICKIRVFESPTLYSELTLRQATHSPNIPLQLL